MPKITIIGAGSGFGRSLIVDIVSRPAIRNSTICLCDLNKSRLASVEEFAGKIITAHGFQTEIITGTDRRKLLKDSDTVIIAVSIGGPAYYGKPYEYELKIPEKYGLVEFIGDTMGPGGIFRALRCAPELCRMVDDVAELAPGAILLNYTNPMAPLTKVLTRHAKGLIQVAGLCHGVQGTSKAIADYMGLPFEELTFKVSGINHMAWFTEIKHSKKDVYPLLFAAAEDPEIFQKDPIRFDLMRNFGYFCTESSKHSYEYVPYYMHDEELKKTHSRTMGTEEQVTQEWLADMGVAIKEANSMELVRSHEYASGIIEAFTTNEPFMFIGNVINDNLSPDFHNGCCIEVPCLVDRNGIHPSRVNALPPQCAALCRTNINVQELIACSIENKDKEAAFHALTLDPTACALLDLKQMRAMFNEIWDAEAAMGLLPK